jgi:HEAT repeat protein
MRPAAQEAPMDDQLDLFSWPGSAPRRSENSAPDAIATLHSPPTADELAQLPTAALREWLERDLQEPSAGGFGTIQVIQELAHRRDVAAVPLLVELCRLHAGFDRARGVVPEVRAAIDALATLRAVQAAGPILRLAEHGGLGVASTVAALRFLAAVRHAPAAGFARRCLAHESPTLRAAAAVLAAALGLRDQVEVLWPMAQAGQGEEAKEAAIALGRLGHRPAKPLLEARLRAAVGGDAGELADALATVADAESVVVIGQTAERSDTTVALALIEILAEIEAPNAARWLTRLANSADPRVRAAAAESLEEIAKRYRE